MKQLPILFLCASLTELIQAEVLIIPAGQGGKLTIVTGEVAIVSIYQQTPGPAPYRTDIIAGGVTNTLPLHGSSGDAPAAFAGPMEIVFGPESSHLISYKRMQGNAIKSQILSYGHTNSISVPDGKTLRFFSLVPRPNFEIGVKARLAKGTNNFDFNLSSHDTEFSGPLEIEFSVPYSTAAPIEKAAVYSYYFTEDFLVVPDVGFLQGPTGAFEITVERSADLTNWFPVMVQNTSNDQKAFYRLKLAR